ncbi:MAG: hypothetical protein J7647_26565 [Cyanobacteria bacterium SBLK]|nr:hypothetical protein [Cyanobacteria bacterium SBLK]
MRFHFFLGRQEIGEDFHAAFVINVTVLTLFSHFIGDMEGTHAIAAKISRVSGFDGVKRSRS